MKLSTVYYSRDGHLFKTDSSHQIKYSMIQPPYSVKKLWSFSDKGLKALGRPFVRFYTLQTFYRFSFLLESFLPRKKIANFQSFSWKMNIVIEIRTFNYVLCYMSYNYIKKVIFWRQKTSKFDSLDYFFIESEEDKRF